MAPGYCSGRHSGNPLEFRVLPRADKVRVHACVGSAAAVASANASGSCVGRDGAGGLCSCLFSCLRDLRPSFRDVDPARQYRLWPLRSLSNRKDTVAFRDRFLLFICTDTE